MAYSSLAQNYVSKCPVDEGITIEEVRDCGLLVHSIINALRNSASVPTMTLSIRALL